MFGLSTIIAQNEAAVKGQPAKEDGAEAESQVRLVVRYAGEQPKTYKYSEEEARYLLGRLSEIAQAFGYNVVRFSEEGFTGTNPINGESQTVVILH